MGNIIKKHKTIFIHIPKNAGTSVLKILGEERANHEKWFFFKQKYPEEWATYFKFAIVRNPWDRVVSNYKYAKLERSYWHSSDGGGIYGKHKDYDLLKNKSFDETVYLLSRNFKLFKHQGWGNQHSYVCNKKLVPQVKILRFEKLSSEFNDIFPDFVLPQLNQSGNDNYKAFYNDDTRKLIGQIYKKDIEIFKYSF